MIIVHHTWCILPLCNDWFDFLCFNATSCNISAISWWPVLVVGEAGVPGENHRPWASNWQTLSHAAASRVHPFYTPVSRWGRIIHCLSFFLWLLHSLSLRILIISMVSCNVSSVNKACCTLSKEMLISSTNVYATEMRSHMVAALRLGWLDRLSMLNVVQCGYESSKNANCKSKKFKKHIKQ